MTDDNNDGGTVVVTASPTPTAFQSLSHIIPLIIIGLAILIAIVVLLMFDKPVDRVLYDQIPVIIGAIAGVTWMKR